MLVIVILLVFVSSILTVFFIIPMVVKGLNEFNQRRARDFAREMDRAMEVKSITTVMKLYYVAPLIGAAAGFLVMPDDTLRVVGMVAGFVLGLVVPRFVSNFILKQRKKLFDLQLVDGLMIMSSSFRGGLSLVQSMEAVVEEMPDPIRHEFSIVLGENKMGVDFDEALNRLYKRMPSPGLQQMVSAILLSRETGGNLPVIFSRIVSTIRERRKIEENLAVLTLQGRLQAFVMSGLPVAFFFFVQSTNPQFFKVMTTTDLGKLLLMAATGLWLIGVFLILKISAFSDY
jgi:tight adherence protein B